MKKILNAYNGLPDFFKAIIWFMLGAIAHALAW